MSVLSSNRSVLWDWCGFFFFTRISFLKLLLFCCFILCHRSCSLQILFPETCSTTEGEEGSGLPYSPRVLGELGSWGQQPFKRIESVSVQWQSNFCCDMWDLGVDSCHHLIDMWLFQRKVGLCQYRGTKVTREYLPQRRWSSKAVTHKVELSVRNGSSVLFPCQSDHVGWKLLDLHGRLGLLFSGCVTLGNSHSLSCLHHYQL